MKIRAGFVSNSSSSSFICVVGKVIDSDKFSRFIHKNKISTDVKLFYGYEGEQFWKQDVYDCDFESQTYMPKFEDNTLYFGFVNCGDEGDYEFSNRGEYDELDYDIDLSFFSEQISSLYCASEKEGVDVVYNHYYAGRNG